MQSLALSRQEASRLHSEARQAHSGAEEARAEAAALVARAESRDRRSKEAWEAAEGSGRAAAAQQAQVQAALAVRFFFRDIIIVLCVIVCRVA